MKFRQKFNPKTIKIGGKYWVDFIDPFMGGCQYRGRVLVSKTNDLMPNAQYNTQYCGPNWFTVKIINTGGPQDKSSIWINRESFKYEVK